MAIGEIESPGRASRLDKLCHTNKIFIYLDKYQPNTEKMIESLIISNWNILLMMPTIKIKFKKLLQKEIYWNRLIFYLQ